MSSGSVQERSRFNESNQIAQSLSETIGQIESDQRAYDSAERSTKNVGANFIRTIAQAEMAGKSINYDKLGEMSEATQSMVQEYKTKAQNYGYGWDQSNDMSLKSGVDGSGSFSIGGTKGEGVSKGKAIAGGLISGVINTIVGVDGKVTASNNSSQSFQDNNSLNDEIAASKNFSKVARALTNESFAENNHLDTSYAKDLRTNFEKQEGLATSISKRKEMATHYSNSLSNIKSQDNSTDFDRYHQLEQSVASAYGVSTKDAHDMIEKGDSRVSLIRDQLHSSNDSSRTHRQINQGRRNLSDNNIDKELNQFEGQYAKTINKTPDKEVIQEAANYGFDVYRRPVKGDLENKTNELININEEKINNTNKDIEAKQNSRQEKINKYEEDRIGRGIIGGGLGIGGPRNPSTPKPKKNKKEKDEFSFYDQVD